MRISRLEQPGFANLVATAYISGMSRKKMAAEFGVSEVTITNWKKDVRVRTIAKELHDDREVAMTRKIDAEMERRLLDPEILKDMDHETLLKFRKEVRGEASKVEIHSIDSQGAKSEAWKALDENPNLASDLAALLTKEAAAEDK